MKIKVTFLDVLFFSMWPVVAYFLAIFFPVNALASSVLFFGIPIIYLSVKKPKLTAKCLTFSIFSIPLIILIDYVAEITRAWSWPLPESVLPRLFGVVSIEVITWAFLNYYIVILFYEYFFDRHKTYKLWTNRSNEFLYVTLALFAIFLFVLFMFPGALRIPFWYLNFGSVFLLTPILFQIKLFPRVFTKILKASIYFIYLNLVYELTALSVHWWSFDGGQFIGWVSLGQQRFPLEEFIFWVLLFSISLLSYYERFFDDER